MHMALCRIPSVDHTTPHNGFLLPLHMSLVAEKFKGKNLPSLSDVAIDSACKVFQAYHNELKRFTWQDPYLGLNNKKINVIAARSF